MKDENLKIVKKSEFSAKNSIIIINDFIKNKYEDKLKKYIQEIHNADIADILHNLEPETRSKLVDKIRDNFDPEILTYLNDSLRDEIVEILDLKQLASNATKLDVDDAVDLIEDLQESDQTTFLDS